MCEAAARALQYPGGPELQLGVMDIQLNWKGSLSSTIRDSFCRILRDLTNARCRPSVAIVHVGQDDLGQKPLQQLRSDITHGAELVAAQLPQARLFWSDILPPSCRNQVAPSTGALAEARKRLNRAANAPFGKTGGGRIQWSFRKGNSGQGGCARAHLSPETS